MSLARKYDTLLDPSPESPVMEPGESLPTVAEPICIKFCTGGVVSSRKWVAGYVTIIDRYYLMLHESRVRRWLTVSLWLFVLMLYCSVARFYDSRESCENNPSDTLLSISLTNRHSVSDIKVKDYSQDKVRIVSTCALLLFLREYAT
jgi:uncharacterized membrane protein